MTNTNLQQYIRKRGNYIGLLAYTKHFLTTPKNDHSCAYPITLLANSRQNQEIDNGKIHLTNLGH